MRGESRIGSMGGSMVESRGESRVATRVESMVESRGWQEERAASGVLSAEY